MVIVWLYNTVSQTDRHGQKDIAKEKYDPRIETNRKVNGKFSKSMSW